MVRKALWTKSLCLYVRFTGELQRQKEFEVAMFMYRTGEQQNAYNAMNSIKTRGKLIYHY